MSTPLDPETLAGLHPLTLDDEILDVAEVADLLRIDPRTIMRLCREGKIPARKIGKEWRFSRYVLLGWIQHPTEGAESATQTGAEQAKRGQRTRSAAPDPAAAPANERRKVYEGQEVVTQAEAAMALGCSSRTIQRMIDRGELAAIQVGKQQRVLRDALLARLGESATPATTEGDT